MIRISQLDGFRGTGQVVRGVSFHVNAGEIVGLLGRNGVGKTSTIEAIMGLIRRRGDVRLDDVDLGALDPHWIARAGIALVPQGRGLFPHLTVRENLDLAWHGKGRMGEQALEHAIAYFKPLANFLSRTAGTLSGGEQQMVAIARVLLNRPKIVLMDEPTEGLAPLFVERVGEIIKSVAASGVGVLLVEQNLRLALDVSQRVLFLEKGALAHSCSIDEARSEAVLHRYVTVAQ